ncbi:hypothetical protein [Azospirillum endophyticum]
MRSKAGARTDEDPAFGHAASTARRILVCRPMTGKRVSAPASRIQTARPLILRSGDA